MRATYSPSRYEIPLEHADEMLQSVCQGLQVEKTRYVVPHAGLTWEVDVYEGRLTGVVLAEVELVSEDQAIQLPDWIGQEVTGDPRFKKAALVRLSAELIEDLTTDAVIAHHARIG